MNKSDLVDRLVEEHGLSRKQAEATVGVLFNAITKALVDGDRVEIRGFGSFVCKHYRARAGRNPRTGGIISIAAKRLPCFKVGKELRERVNT